jgi:hypothetical protein
MGDEIGGVGAILRPFGAAIMFTRIGALCLLCCVFHQRRCVSH